jgi:hypothetical protein
MDFAGLAVAEDEDGRFLGVVAQGEGIGGEEDGFEGFFAECGGVFKFELFIAGEEVLQGVLGTLFGLFVGEAEAVVGGEGVYFDGDGLGVLGLEALEVIEAEGFDTLDGGGGEAFGGGDDGIDEVSDVVAFEATAVEGFGGLRL